MATARALEGKTYGTLVEVIGDLCAARGDAARRVVLRNALKSPRIVGELKSGGFIPTPAKAFADQMVTFTVQDARSPYDVARELTDRLTEARRVT